MGREQAGAARGQHGASRAGQPAAGGGRGFRGAHGRACLPAFLPSGALAAAGGGAAGLRSERAVMNRQGASWSASVCSARGARSLGSAGPRQQQVGRQSPGHGNSRYKPPGGAGRSREALIDGPRGP